MEALLSELRLGLEQSDPGAVVSAIRGLLGRVHEHHAARRTLEGVDSETDHYPVGEVRSHWNSTVLEELDLELADYIQRVRPKLEEVVQVLQQELD